MMKAIPVYEFTLEEYEQEINTGKQLILNKLFKDGILSAADYENYSLNYAIIIKRPSFFSQLWKQIYKKDKKQYLIVKQDSLLFHDEEERHKRKFEVIDMESHRKEE